MHKEGPLHRTFWIIGPVFAALWASASVASKLGLQSAQPFVISLCRFCMASLVMLVLAHIVLRKPLPVGKQWRQLAIFGLLNVALYLGFFIVAIHHVSAGLGSLAVALNPILITVLYALLKRHRIPWLRLVSLLLGFSGVVVCAYPLIMGSHASIPGLLTLFLSMLVYSVGTIYFQQVNWQELHILTINGWQTFFGALFTLPMMYWQWQPELNQFDAGFWAASAWLAIVVSIGAVQSWIYLLRHYGERSSYWLFLAPIFGFMYSNWLTGEPLGWLTLLGTLMVLSALGIHVSKKKS